MKKFITILFLLSLLACTSAKKMQENLVGIWEGTSLVANGHETIPNIIKDLSFEFKADGKFINSNSINTVEATYKVRGNEIHLDDASTSLNKMQVNELSRESLILSYTSGDQEIIARFKRK